MLFLISVSLLLKPGSNRAELHWKKEFFSACPAPALLPFDFFPAISFLTIRDHFQKFRVRTHAGNQLSDLPAHHSMPSEEILWPDEDLFSDVHEEALFALQVSR